MSARLAAWARDRRDFEWQGHRLFVRDQGTGPAAVLLHGYPTGSYDWHAIWPWLQPGLRLIAPDFLGMGFSDKPRSHDYTITSHAASVDALLVALGIGEFHLVGHDLGVRVAQELLALGAIRAVYWLALGGGEVALATEIAEWWADCEPLHGLGETIK